MKLSNLTLVVVLVLIALMACQSKPQQKIVGKNDQLSINFTRLESNHFQVELAFVGNTTGITELHLYDWAGIDDLSSHVSDLVVIGGGRTLPVTSLSDGKWSVQHQPAEDVLVRYVLKANERQLSDSDRDYYRPIINDQLFHAVGHNSLALPQHLPDTINLQITWNVGTWNVISSIGSVSNNTSLRVATSDLYSSLWVAGPLQVERRIINGNPLYVTLHGDHWSFNAKQLADFVETITQAERDYFNDHNFDFYWVNAIAVGEPKKDGHSFGGTRLHNSFALFLNPTTKLTIETPAGSPILTLLAHEMMHNWFGGKLFPKEGQEEASHYWFTEGFTDYFTKQVLFEAGLISREQFIYGLNESLQEYYANPAHKDSNKLVAENFWQSFDHQRIPYLRGELVAFALDQALRTNKNNLKRIVNQWLISEPWRNGFDLNMILLSLKQYLSEAQLGQVKSLIHDGAMPNWQQWFSNSCATTEIKKLHQWDSGFDTEASVENNIIVGVNPKSEAHKAGLRNGQKLLGGSIFFGDLSKPIELTVEADDKEKQISYWPKGKDSEVLQVMSLCY